MGLTLNGVYRLVREVATGGMGTIFEGEHQRLPGKRYAIKVLHEATSAVSLQRFQREATITSELGHDHIVEVHDFNIAESGFPYLVMELLDGEDLSKRIQRVAPMPLDQVVRIVHQTALGLEAAHRAGVVHRDLTPKNIFLCRRAETDDFVKILDFGVSKVRDAGQAITREHGVPGTPSYMSPEQTEGMSVDVDERADIFALGVVAWEMLTGRRAFEAKTASGTVYQVAHIDPMPVAQIRPDIPEGIDVVLLTAMAKSRNQRYPSAMMMADELTAAARHAASSANSPSAVKLPRASTDAPDTVELWLPSIRQTTQKRVLFVDDSPSMCSLVSTWLSQSGYQVSIASDGDQGHAKIQTDRPDLVIADVNMPRRDGFALCRTIKDNPERAIPVILYTRLDEATDIVNGLAAGADAFVVKGSGARDLLRQVEYLLGDVQHPAQRKSAAIANLRGQSVNHGRKGIFKRLFDALFHEVAFDILALLVDGGGSPPAGSAAEGRRGGVDGVGPKPLFLLGSHYQLSAATADGLTARIVTSYARTSGRPIAVTDVDAQLIVIDESSAWLDADVDLRRSVTVPLLDAGNVIGCLGVFSFEDHPWLDANVRFFCDIGVAAANALRGA